MGIDTEAMMVTWCTFANLCSSSHALHKFSGVGGVDAGQGGGEFHLSQGPKAVPVPKSSYIYVSRVDH